MAKEKSKKKEETEIPTVEEMKEKARKIGKEIPDIKEKRDFVIKARGMVIEFSLAIEGCFDQLITETGKEMVFDQGKKGLHLIKGIRDKKTFPVLKQNHQI